MHSTRVVLSRRVRAAAAAGMAASSGAAMAFPTGFNAWQERYNGQGSTLVTRMEQLTGSGCNVCHAPPERFFPGTCYREDLITMVSLTGGTVSQAIGLIEDLDSDGDGVPNRVEILTPRTDTPGAVGYHPGLRGETGVDECGIDPTAPATGQRETPAGYCYANCDGSTVIPALNALDFLCYLDKFRAGAAFDELLQAKHYANCDRSTVFPMVNALDFVCFLQRFQQGCK